MRIAVVGAGVAGCAAAVAAAEAGASVVLLERSHHLGGVAVDGEHRTICGLAAIDAERPDLLEPGLTTEWVQAIATGEPFRRGRVWLWPTDSAPLQAGLRRRLASAGVAVRFAVDVKRMNVVDGRITALDGAPCDAVIDAAGIVPRLLGLPVRGPSQWAAHRSIIALPGVEDGRAARVRLLATIRSVVGDAAAALEPMVEDRWQLSLDVQPGSDVAAVAALAQRVAVALGGTLLACAVRVAERDEGRAIGGLTLADLFAQRERGLCWAAWPREEHGPAGVLWQWPDHDRHGVPESAVRLPSAPGNLWLVGKGMPVESAAASALRVIGSGLAIGAAVGARAAHGVGPSTG